MWRPHSIVASFPRLGGTMILYIAEKPSLGRAIADAIPGAHNKRDGHIQLANGDRVSWCIGHLLEQAEPEAYDPIYKKWSTATLPILPKNWKLTPKSKTRKQLTLLKKLIGEADQLVHAGDPDREGQLLVDEVINYARVSAAKRAAVKRVLISDLNRPAVAAALDNLRDNSDFIPLSVSALARSRADWLYGLNMTRAYTLQGQAHGYQGVLSVGRVQTPLLGLVVRRDSDIEKFTPQDYFDVLAHLRTPNKDRFYAKWQPSDSCQAFLDHSGRNLSRPLAENVARRISNQDATITRYQAKQKRRSPPLPHALSSLQIDANKAFGLTAQQVLDVCQSLYEKHKLITYPRSDSRHLPKEHHRQGGQITARALSNLSSMGVLGLGELKWDESSRWLDFSRRSKAWNDAKVDAHHAIIPTNRTSKNLSKTELQVYQLIVRNYLAQFMEAEIYSEVAVELQIVTGCFAAKARTTLELGWCALFPRKVNKDSDENGIDRQSIPVLTVGQVLKCERGEVKGKQTSPPKHFTEATLLAAMTGIARFVRDDRLRHVLKETDGLGTEATRAGILELLFKRRFLRRKGKQILATAEGTQLIGALPEDAVWPDMTAQWESQLSAIKEQQQGYEDFMAPLTQSLHGLVMESQQVSMQNLRGLGTSASKYPKKSKYRKSRTKAAVKA